MKLDKLKNKVTLAGGVIAVIVAAIVGVIELLERAV